MDINSFGRVPPQSLEAEQSVLGSLLQDKEVLPIVAEILKSEDFYKEGHRHIYEAVMDLFDSGEPVDLVTVSDKLRQSGSLEAVGGVEYLANIAFGVPTTANVSNYAKIVWEKSILRKLIKGASRVIDIGFEANDEVPDILDQAEKTIFDVMQQRNIKNIFHIKDIIGVNFNRLEELYNSKSDITGVPSGFADLDSKTAGFQKSDLIILASRPAMGKTSLAINFAQYAAARAKVPVAIFSLEMSKEQIVNRIISGEVLIDSLKLRTGKLADEDWSKMAKALGPLSEAPIYIDDSAGSSIQEIGAKCRRLKLEKNIGLIIIDYLQLMTGRGKAENRQQEISDMTRSLKILAKEINVPVIALSQLSRASEARSEHRPMLSDLRESGAIEQDADLVMFLYREDQYKQDSEKTNEVELILAKHRNGPLGTIYLRWFGEYTKFTMLKKD
ncbi:MAG: replicative DNA helicase [Eubacteriales bacterium]|nr:replicative DNA helicase [Eubacteriales bacterium]